MNNKNKILTSNEANATFTNINVDYSNYVYRIKPNELKKWVVNLEKQKKKSITKKNYSVEIAGSTLFFQLNDIKILCDPSEYLTSMLPSNCELDILLITHAHYDHWCGLEYLLNLIENITVIICRVSYSLIIDKLSRQNKYLTIEALKKIAVIIDNAQQININGIKICAYSAGHCIGSMAYCISSFDSDTEIIIAGEYTIREVGGIKGKLPYLPKTSLLFLDATHADSIDWPSGIPLYNRESINEIVKKAYTEKKAPVFACASLGEMQEIYTAVALYQREGGASEYPLIIQGFNNIVLEELAMLGNIPPWDIELKKSNFLMKNAINICSCAFDKSDLGLFGKFYEEYYNNDKFVWLFPNRMSKTCPSGAALYEAYTHPGTPELLQLVLVYNPDIVCLYAHGKSDNFFANEIINLGYKTYDISGGSGRIDF